MFRFKNWKKNKAVSNENTSIIKPKVKIVAVAKDEAAYLPEWVHHHHYFGFDAIDVYVNRTEDNSIAMLNTLKKHVPCLSIHSADWVDTCPDEASNFMQFIIYAKAFETEKRLKNFDYIMFLDIDEFWTPQNMIMSVQDCIALNHDAQSISFSWINEHGQNDDFQAIQLKTYGQLSPLVKSLVSIDADIERVALHLPKLSEGKACMVDGESFVSERENRECLHKDLLRLRPVMIIHRMFRSPMEYISLLSRGRPSDSLQLKLNRGGYNRASGAHSNYSLDEAAFDTFNISLSKLLSQPEVENCLRSAREFVEGRFEQTLAAISEMPMEYYGELFSVFKDCDKRVTENLVESIRNSPDLKQCNSVEKLVALASVIQKYDVFLARDILAMASEL